MILLNWYREWIEIRASLIKPCDSCETLKQEIERLTYVNDKLLSRVMEKPEPIPERTEAPTPMKMPRTIPWNVRRQMLEREDRAKAEILKNVPKPDSIEDKKETEVFEKELKDATERREKQSS